jgi:hypothetical protein
MFYLRKPHTTNKKKSNDVCYNLSNVTNKNITLENNWGHPTKNKLTLFDCMCEIAP